MNVVQTWAAWFVVALAVTSQFLVGRKLAVGWIFNLACQATLLAYNFMTRQYGFIVCQIMGGFLAARSYVTWTRDAVPQEKENHCACDQSRDLAGR